MERILASNISEHLEKHNNLSNCQYGFRQKRSYETQLIGFIDELARNMQNELQNKWNNVSLSTSQKVQLFLFLIPILCKKLFVTIRLCNSLN